MDNSKNVICDLLWSWPIINLARNEVKMCCRTNKVFKVSEEELKTDNTNVFSNLIEFKQDRANLLSGIKTENCKYCWDLEEKNIKSPRRGTFEDILKISSYSESNDLLISKFPTQLEIIIGNNCDMQCAYCGPQSSSKWAEYYFKKDRISNEHRKYLQQIVKNNSSNFNEIFWKWFDQNAIHSLKKIKIIGGEPAFNPEFYKLMNNLSERYSEAKKSVRVVVTTNLNMIDIEKFIACFNDKNIIYSIHVSIETIQQRAEFIRIGLNWQRFSNNIEKILNFASKNKNVNVSILSSVNSLSITSLKEFLMWINELSKRFELPIGIQENIINSVPWLRPTILDKSYAKYMEDAIAYCIEQECFLNYLPFLRTIKQAIENNENFDEQNKNLFNTGISSISEISGLSFLNIFPEMKSLVDLKE